MTVAYINVETHLTHTEHIHSLDQEYSNVGHHQQSRPPRIDVTGGLQ